MNKKKRIKIVIISIVSIPILLLVIMIILGKGSAFFAIFGNNDDEVSKSALDLNDIYNADIMLYGESVNFEETLIYRKIDTLTEEIFTATDRTGIKTIIVNDMNSTCTIKDEEFLLIKKCVEDKGYDFIYIGEQYMPKLKELGFMLEYSEDEMSISYIGSDLIGRDFDYVGNPHTIHGFWKKEDYELYKEGKRNLGQSLTFTLDVNARRAAKTNAESK